VLILERPWTRQPQTVVRPAAQYADMAVGWIASNPNHNCGSVGRQWTKLGTTVKSVTQNGITEYSNAYSSPDRYATDIVNPATVDWPGITIVAVVNTRTLADDQYCAPSTWLTTSNYYGGYNLTLGRTGSSRNRLEFLAGNSTSYITPTTYNATPATNDFEVGDNIVVAAGWNKSTIWIMYNRNGVLTYNEAAHTPSWQNQNCVFNTLGYNRPGDRSCLHAVAMTATLPRDLRSVAVNLVRNPWQLFEPQQIYIPTAAAAASSLPILSASTFVPGSVTATGWRPRVAAALRTLPAGGQARQRARRLQRATRATTARRRSVAPNPGSPPLARFRSTRRRRSRRHRRASSTPRHGRSMTT